MYKHILIPTDGSRLARKGIREGIKLAAALGARVTGAYVMPPFVPAMYTEAATYAPGFTRAEYKKLSEAMARKALSEIERAARAARVACRTKLVSEVRPWRGILRAARESGCDVIVMASHGRGAMAGLLLGSETSRVLAHSKIPVLVAR